MDRPPLSDKAKGKQRAIEPESQTGSSSRTEDVLQPRTLTIRFTEGMHDLAIVIHPNDTVRDLKKKIQTERPRLLKRRLRLIHSGRLLTDGTFVHGWLRSLEDRQRKSKAIDFEDINSAPDDTSAAVTWVHCSVGPEISEAEEEESIQTTQITPARGFDRLVAAGFTEEDIAGIRNQFHNSREGLTGAVPDADAEEHARALEEQWIDDMDGPGGGTDFDQSLDGTPDGLYTTLLQGIGTGFFFAFIPFFFLRQLRPAAFFSDEYDQVERTPSVIFSKRMQMALVIGFLVNILLGVLKFVS